MVDRQARAARSEQIAKIRASLLRAPAGRATIEHCETIFEKAIAEAKSLGMSIISGSFGAYDAIDAVTCVARLHTLGPPDMGDEMYLACEVLGWNHDQIWAFIAGYDLELGRLIDPRALRHPDIVDLGTRLRAKHCPRKPLMPL